eukprot:snap_masked-scaffold_14-processed-gene-9.9-mRNA-1 protein AED:1.00 eAED:1.00 QI:0/0/0/0/1/1/3/0/417
MAKKTTAVKTVDPPKEIGHWKIIKKLGEGAFGSVYSASVDSSKDAPDFDCVLKIAFHSISTSKKKTKKQKEIEQGTRLLFWCIGSFMLCYREYQLYQNFLKEIDCIPRRPKQKFIFSKKDLNGYNFSSLAMEKLEGNLRDKLNERFVFTETIVSNIAIQLIHGLKQIHGKNICVKDIKLENIMYKQNKLYFVDFGASVLMRQHNGALQNVKVAGTDLFMALTSLSEAPSARDDLVSLTYLLAYLFIGSLPWESCKSEDEVVRLKKSFEGDDFENLFTKSTDLTKALSNLFVDVSNYSEKTVPNYDELSKRFLKYAGVTNIDSVRNGKVPLWTKGLLPVKQKTKNIKKVSKKSVPKKKVVQRKSVQVKSKSSASKVIDLVTPEVKKTVPKKRKPVKIEKKLEERQGKRQRKQTQFFKS